MRGVLSAFCLPALVAFPAAAVSIEAITMEGELLPGASLLDGFVPNETVRLNGSRDVSVAANGDFALAVTTGPLPLPNSTWYLFGSVGGADATALRRETTINGNDPRSFHPNIGIGPAGELYYGAILNGPGSPASLWRDGTLLFKRGDPIPAGPLQGQFFGDVATSVKVRADGSVVWKQAYSGVAGGADTGGALMSGIGAYDTLLKSGDPVGTLGLIANYSQAITIFSNPEYSFSGANLLTATSLDTGEAVMLLNGAPLSYGSGGPLVTNSLIPAADGGATEHGVPIERLRFSSYWGVNEAGDYAFAGNVELTTDPDNNTDGDILVHNGSILYREGDVVDGVTLEDGFFQEVKVLEDGRVAFFYKNSLFVGDQRIAAPGDTVTLLDGSTSTLSTLSSGKLTVAPQAAAGGGGLPVLYFGGRLANGRSAMMRLAPAAPLTGDFNGDGAVDAADYTLWRDTFGSTTELAADADGNNEVDTADYLLWKANYEGPAPSPATGPPQAGPPLTAAPEPASLASLLGALALGGRRPRRRAA